MSFTVLRVEVQEWEYEEIFLFARGQSEEGVEADDVVEEEGHQEECGHRGMIPGVEFDDQNDIAEYICCRAENVQDHNGRDRDHDDQDHDHLHLYHLLLIETTIIFLFETQNGDVNSFFGVRDQRGDLVSLWT